MRGLVRRRGVMFSRLWTTRMTPCGRPQSSRWRCDMSRYLGATLVITIVLSISIAAQTPSSASQSKIPEAKDTDTKVLTSSSTLSNDQLVDRRDALQVDLRAVNDELVLLRDLQNIVSQLLTARAKKD